MKINTEQQLELVDGNVINLTLTFGSLNRLSEKDPKLIEEYFTLQSKKEMLNDLEIAHILYIAYRCAENVEPTLEYKAFLDLIPSNRRVIYNMYAILLYPKNENSSSHFQEEH